MENNLYVTSMRMNKETKKRLKIFCVNHGLTTSEAIKKLLEIAEKEENKNA